jgi:D-glycero-D-manno-heptose 1,7-bisphosphate phosphatase
MNSDPLKIDKTWSLFLDRDGVINKRIVGGYVQSWEQFEFLPGVPVALKLLAGNFSRILVVSNQQGVGKGLITDKDVKAIHTRMAEEIAKEGGSVDTIYYCPSLEEDNSILRKPNIGMALKARKDYPDINFKRSIMVGDSISDMIFGRRLKMKTVFLSNDIAVIRKGAEFIDFVYEDLLDFANSLTYTISPNSTPGNISPSHHFTISPTTPPSPTSPPSPSWPIQFSFFMLHGLLQERQTTGHFLLVIKLPPGLLLPME